MAQENEIIYLRDYILIHNLTEDEYDNLIQNTAGLHVLVTI